MARKFKSCLRCRRTLLESELRDGSYSKTEFGLVCAQCAETLREQADPEDVKPPPSAPPALDDPPQSAPPAVESAILNPQSQMEPPPPAPAVPSVSSGPSDGSDHTQALLGLRQEAEGIRRHLMFEKSSPWNVVAAVVQCIALATLFVALSRWVETPQGPVSLLLLALTLQIMALTFFLLGRL